MPKTIKDIIMWHLNIKTDEEFYKLYGSHDKIDDDMLSVVVYYLDDICKLCDCKYIETPFTDKSLQHALDTYYKPDVQLKDKAKMWLSKNHLDTEQDKRLFIKEVFE